MTAQTVLGKIFRSLWVERSAGCDAVQFRSSPADASPPPEPDTGFGHEDPDPTAAPRTAPRARRFCFRWTRLATGGHTVDAAARIAAPGTRSRRRRPVFNPPIVALRLTVPALIAVAMLLGAGAPVRAFPGLDQPSVSIAAEHGSYGFGIDDVIFKLRRAGPADDAVSVRVSLAQAHLYLPTDRLNAVVRFRAGKRDAELRIRAQQFNGPATQSGALSATLVAAFGYTVGHPDSARTRMVVKNPAITVRPEQASYTVEPDDGAVRVTFVARTEGELPRPGKAFSLAVSSKAASDETAARRVARGVSQTVEFKPRNFVSTGGKWEASRTVSFSTAETAEGLEVMFKRAASTPERIRPRNADGTPCANDVCMVPIIMTQSEEPTLTIAAGSDTYAFGIDNVVFTVTRNGTAEEEISGTVTLAQDEDFLDTNFLRLDFTIAADETSTDMMAADKKSSNIVLSAALFDGDATQSGDLTATIEAGDGYTVGTPGAATVRMVVADSSITVRPEHATYRFDEDDAAASVTFIARTAPDARPPSAGFFVTVTAKARSDGAGSPDDYASLSEIVRFDPSDFVESDDEWEARKEVALTIVDDDETEGDETFDLELEGAPGLSERIKLRQADGSACPAEGCLTPVTIVDNDGPAVERIAISPVPPEASADHGPVYRMDDFLALPEGAVHGQGATLTLTLTLDTEVTVTGAPELVLDIYDRERRARYTGGSGTRQLTFTWTVAKGDNDPDGLGFVSLDLNGGTIRDCDGRDFLPETLAPQHFAEHRVRGGLFAMRMEVSGSAREGEPFEIRVIRDGGYDEPAVAIVGVTDSALPHIPQLYSPALNGPGAKQVDFHDGKPGEPGVRTSTRTVTPLGDGLADEARTLTVRLVITDAGIYRHTGQRIRAWYLTEGPLEVTVPVIDTGQPLAEAGLRVHGTSVREAPGAKLAFRVTLSPHSEAPVTVDYQTGDDPFNEPKAVAGEDYVATDGMLTFEPGETLKTVEVEVLADDHDEGFETMRLFLSNAQGARIDTDSGLGVIKNDGPIPRAWIGRFGRAVADQVLDAVESRMRAAREPGIEMTLAGQRVGGQSPTGGSDGAARLSDQFGDGSDPAWRRDAGLTSMASRGVTQGDLLTGTSFAVTSESGQGAYVSLWGRGAVSRFDGREGKLTLDGEVASAMVGVDWAREDWTAGLIVSRSDAEGGYEGHSGGRVAATLTGFYPWGRVALSERVDAWGAAGYGTGELTVTPKKPGTEEDGTTVRTDLDLRMAAVGLRGVLVDGGSDSITLTGKTDALAVQTASDAARGPDGGNLAAARASVTRLRLGLEGSRPMPLGGGATLTPSVEVGVRHDGGDAETGVGLDMGGGLALSVPEHGLQVELRGRGLLTHDVEGFRERGFSGSLAWDPTLSSEQGPKLTLTQTVGASASGGADDLLARGTLAGLNASDGSGDNAGLQSRRLEMKVGYGFGAGGGRFASIPEIGFGLSDSGRDYSLGWRLASDRSRGAGALQLSAEARRYETGGGNRPPEHRIGVRLSARW